MKSRLSYDFLIKKEKEKEKKKKKRPLQIIRLIED